MFHSVVASAEDLGKTPQYAEMAEYAEKPSLRVFRHFRALRRFTLSARLRH
jgi:hypothetical protein